MTTDPRAIIAEARSRLDWSTDRLISFWTRHGRAVIDGYAAALDELDALKSHPVAATDTPDDLELQDRDIEWLQKRSADLAALRFAIATLRHEVACGRTHNLLALIDAMIGPP